MISRNSSITLDEMAEAQNVSKKTIHRKIQEMEDIVRVGPAKGGHWEVIERNE